MTPYSVLRVYSVVGVKGRRHKLAATHNAWPDSTRQLVSREPEEEEEQGEELVTAGSTKTGS